MINFDKYEDRLEKFEDLSKGMGREISNGLS